jgi:hypothetical protein
MPDPLLPVAPGQATTEIVRERQKNRFNAFERSTPTNQWYVKDHELRYDVDAGTSRSRFDPGTHYQYLRPLTEGDTVDLSFWWKEGVTEIHPSIGRTVLRLSQNGTMATWARVLNDVASNGYIPAEQLVPPPDLMAKDNVPIDNAWNKVTMTRTGDQVVVTMNGKPLATIPIAESARPGFMRQSRKNALIGMIKLTGNWPSELPEDLTRLADR